jgi:hypothetical protein
MFDADADYGSTVQVGPKINVITWTKWMTAFVRLMMTCDSEWNQPEYIHQFVRNGKRREMQVATD